MMKILVVDTLNLRPSPLVSALRLRGHCPVRVQWKPTLVLPADEVDVVVIDHGQQSTHGFATLRRIRDLTDAPILTVAHKSDPLEPAQWLEHGADEYISKPILARELTARVEALGRRSKSTPRRFSSVLDTQDISMDPEARVVRVGSERVRLTRKEFEVLTVLARRAGTPVSRRTIMLEVWGGRHDPNSRSLDVHLVSLRTKLGQPGLLQTVHGFGYRLG